MMKHKWTSHKLNLDHSINASWALPGELFRYLSPEISPEMGLNPNHSFEKQTQRPVQTRERLIFMKHMKEEAATGVK